MTNYSIIIPHYNIPDLLMRCLKSIPVREDVQVVVVDDCSPGVEMYKERYPELSRPYLELYSTPIGGSAGRARNVGLEHAKGKWIIFADADDYFNPCIGEVLDEYVNSDKDLIFFYCDSKDSDTGNPANRNQRYNRKLDKYNADSIDYTIRYELYSPWGKILRHSLIIEHNIEFQEIEYGNDVLFSAQVGFYTRNLVVDKRYFYTNTYRSGSLFYLRNNQNLKSRLYAHISEYNFLKNKGITYKKPIFKFCIIYYPQIKDHNFLRHTALDNGIGFLDFELQFFSYLVYRLIKRVLIVLHLKSFAKRIL